MKNAIALLMICSFFLLKANGQTIPEKDAQLMDTFIKTMLTFEKEKIESESLQKVFTGSFYTVIPTYNQSGGVATCIAYSVVIKNGKLHELENVDETKPLDLLFSLVNESFTLSSEADAVTFEMAIDNLYPMQWSDSEEEKKHYKQENKWMFLRGDFFGAKKGFIVTVDQNSKIVQIDYDLEAVKQE